MALEIHLGDGARLKKRHPCGGDRWQVTRLGADIGLQCAKCGRHTLLRRSQLERQLVERIPRDRPPSPNP